MREQRFPAGWDQRRVQDLIAELDARTEEEWIVEDEVAVDLPVGQTIVTVPVELMPAIRQLLAAHKSSA